jgi:hypothetical protein
VTADLEPGGPRVSAVRSPSRGPSAGLVVLLIAGAIVAAVAVSLVGGPGPAPAPLANVSASPSVTAAASAPPAAAVPQPIAAPTTPSGARSLILVLRDVADPAATRGALTGCPGSVRATGVSPAPAITGAAVDAVADTAGRGPGSWLFVPPGIQASTRVWLGDDLVSLAQAVGVPVVAVGTTGEVWLGGPAGATRWYPVATPRGRTAWVMGGDDVVGQGQCGPWIVPSGVARLRSLTCAGVGAPQCLDLLPLVNADMTGVLQPAGDLIVAVPPCIDSHRCYATPLTFVGTPAAWAGRLGDVHAAGDADFSGTLQSVSPGGLPDYALNALARPALPLPTGGDHVVASRCAASLTGPLHASAWDPRVAWVGGTAVVWPTGTAVRFLPTAQLAAPDAPRLTLARPGDMLTLMGMRGAPGDAFNACSVALAPAPGPGGDSVPTAVPGPSAAP